MILELKHAAAFWDWRLQLVKLFTSFIRDLMLLEEIFFEKLSKTSVLSVIS